MRLDGASANRKKSLPHPGPLDARPKRNFSNTGSDSRPHLDTMIDVGVTPAAKGLPATIVSAPVAVLMV
jgi:hypothetical protein